MSRKFKSLPNRQLKRMEKRKLNQLPNPHGPPKLVEVKRVAGRALQARRLALWEADPHCAMCRAVVAYPHGFELDHITPLEAGGSDEPDNWQLLCVWWEGAEKRGCHNDKTVREHRERNKLWQ